MLNQLHGPSLQLGKQEHHNATAGICRSTVMCYTGLEYTWIVGGTCLKVTKLVGTATYIIIVGDNLKYANWNRSESAETTQLHQNGR